MRNFDILSSTNGNSQLILGPEFEKPSNLVDLFQLFHCHIASTMSPRMFDAIPFQLLNRKLAERKTRPVNKKRKF
jgi:hypothetical protein